MSISEPFIRRPVATTLVMMGILIFGIIGYQFLPVSELPNVDFPTIDVSVSFPGASPETMASSVAMPLERQFSTIAGLDSMSSVSALGTTRITLQFSLDRNIDGAAQDVQTAISTAQRLLPEDLPNPPSYRKVNPADQPILVLALSSPILPLSTVNEYADTIMAQRISMINGVAQVMIFGTQKYAVRVQLNPKALHAKGIGFDEVQKAVAKANVNIPTGTLYGKDQAFTVQATGQLYNAEAYKPLIVAYRNGSPVRLREIGTAIDSVENDKIAAWYNTGGTESRSITLAIQRQPGTNTVEVADAIKALLPSFRAQIPASVDLNILYDRSESIHDSIEDVKFSMYLSLCLVILVIFLFLRNISATIIPSLALPLSIIGTFAVMHLLGYSLDNLSLMALTLSVGFVVDDAIVMLENIVRHMEMGKGRLQASLDGAREIGFTILSMTLSLAAVFIPLLFMGGMLGRLLHEFAVTIGVAVLVSGFVSLTLSPMLCSRFLAAPGTEEHGRLYAVTERFFNGMRGFYEVTLTWVLKHRRSMVVLSVVLLAATGYLFWMVPKDFIPSQDTGQVTGFTEAAQGISFEAMAQHQRAVAAIVREDPNVAAFMSTAGATGGNPTRQCGTPDDAPQAEEGPEVDGGPGGPEAAFEAFLHPRNQCVSAKSPGHPDRCTHDQEPVPVHAAGGRHQGTVSVGTGARREIPQPSRHTRCDERPSDLEPPGHGQYRQGQGSGVGHFGRRDREHPLQRYAYGARQISTIYTPSNQYQVIMEVLPEFQLDPTSLGMLYLQSSSGQLVPSESGDRVRPNRWPPHGQPHRAACLRHHIFQPQTRGGPGRCREPDRRRHEGTAVSRNAHGKLPGGGPAVPDIAQGHVDAPDPGHPGYLYGARYPL